jgi:dTDP-4-dehydrorhamnose reductase
MTRLLITGVSGLLGINLALVASDASRGNGPYEVTGLVHSHSIGGVPFDVQSVDLTNQLQTLQVLDKVQPHILINCAAVTDVDKIEANPDLATILNTDLPGLLAKECVHRGIQFLHLSTDAVYDGKQGWYTENDTPHPVNNYARSKLAGENAVLAEYPQAIIARVNFFGWSLSGQRSLGEWLYNNLKAKKPINGFVDVIFCPLIANQLSELLINMLEKQLSGIYHVASRDAMSKYDFGVSLAHQFSLDESLIQPVSYKQVGLLAQRSPNLTLNTSKLTRDLGYPPPDIYTGVRQFHELYQQGYPQRLQSFVKVRTAVN